jgi:Rieske Fe-S protein
MKISRRDFLLLTAGLATAGCQSIEGDSHSSAGKINAGYAADYAKDGVYSRFRDVGFFIVRKDGNLFAISSYCTHRKCKLTAESDNTFYCPCHGSTFDASGHVTKGPARLDLPLLPSSPNDQGQLMVSLQPQPR